MRKSREGEKDGRGTRSQKRSVAILRTRKKKKEKEIQEGGDLPRDVRGPRTGGRSSFGILKVAGTDPRKSCTKTRRSPKEGRPRHGGDKKVRVGGRCPNGERP